MAKKKTTPESSSAVPEAAAVPKKRRAPAKKSSLPRQSAQIASASRPAHATGGNGKSEPTRAEIAEAAYFRHLKRGGKQGNEFEDWVEAERELKDRRR